MNRVFAIAGLLLGLTLVSCAPFHVLPSEVMEGVDKSFDFTAWRMVPNAKVGQKVQLEDGSFKPILPREHRDRRDTTSHCAATDLWAEGSRQTFRGIFDLLFRPHGSQMAGTREPPHRDRNDSASARGRRGRCPTEFAVTQSRLPAYLENSR